MVGNLTTSSRMRRDDVAGSAESRKRSLKPSARPRVLLIANTVWNLRNFRMRLVERLEAHGYEVILAAPPDEEADDRLFCGRGFEPLRFSRKGFNPLAELLALVRFIRLFRRVRPRFVLSWTPKPNIYASLAGRLLGVQVIPNISGLGSVFIRDGLLARLVGALYRHAFARSPRVFFQNDEDMAAFIAAGWLDATRAERLPGSGVYLEHFSAQPLPLPEPFVFLYAGRLLADKGLRELVEAARQLRRNGNRFVLRMAGFLDPGNPTAISRRELDGWIKSGTVEYLGHLDDVHPALAAAHCVVLPSYREGVPRSLLEAAATARPLIATDVRGCRDALVAEQSGMLCTPKSADSLADCMARMLDLSPTALAAMGMAGREHMEQEFSEEIVLAAYLEVVRLKRRRTDVTDN